MSHLERIEQVVKDELIRQGIGSQILWDESQFLYVGYYIVQLVVADGTLLDRVQHVLASVKEQLIGDGIDFDARARAKWTFAGVGDVQPLYANDGSLRAASVVPVYLKSGSSERTAHVIVTWAADKAIREITPLASLSSVANELVRDRLKQGGESAWDPIVEPTIEVNAAAAPYVSRLLRRAA